MNTLQDFFENAKSRNLCERGAKIWEHCKSKKSLIDFALGAWGCDYLATSIAQGWGIDPQEIKKEFEPFNNGKYVRDKDGYTSKMYCLPETNKITIDTTLTLIIGFKGTVISERPCELYLVNCEARIIGIGGVVVQSYNSTVQGRGWMKLTEHNYE